MFTTEPEDSVLKRHAMTAKHFKQSEAANRVPTDSVLLRHHLQLQEAGAIASARVTADQLIDAGAAIDYPQTDYQRKPEKTGLFGLLARLFRL